MDLYAEQKLNSSARKILIAIEDYLRIHSDKSFAEALVDLKITGDEELGNDSQVLNRISSSLYSMLLTRQ